MTNAYTSRHDRFFAVRQRYYTGRPLCRWEEKYEVLEVLDLYAVTNALPGIEGPIAVIAVDVFAGTSADVSKEAALRMAERIRDGYFDLTDDLRNFIEENVGIGTVIPAAA